MAGGYKAPFPWYVGGVSSVPGQGGYRMPFALYIGHAGPGLSVFEVEPIRVWHRQYYRRVYRGVSAVAVAAARADFTFVVSGATVQFTNTSVGLVSSLWDFAGLGGTSQRDPEFTFPTLPGTVETYTVCLQINGDILLTTCKPVTIDLTAASLAVYTLTDPQVYTLTHPEVYTLPNNEGGP